MSRIRSSVVTKGVVSAEQIPTESSSFRVRFAGENNPINIGPRQHRCVGLRDDVVDCLIPR